MPSAARREQTDARTLEAGAVLVGPKLFGGRDAKRLAEQVIFAEEIRARWEVTES